LIIVYKWDRIVCKVRLVYHNLLPIKGWYLFYHIFFILREDTSPIMYVYLLLIKLGYVCYHIYISTSQWRRKPFQSNQLPIKAGYLSYLIYIYIYLFSNQRRIPLLSYLFHRSSIPLLLLWIFTSYQRIRLLSYLIIYVLMKRDTSSIISTFHRRRIPLLFLMYIIHIKGYLSYHICICTFYQRRIPLLFYVYPLHIKGYLSFHIIIYLYQKKIFHSYNSYQRTDMTEDVSSSVISTSYQRTIIILLLS